MRIAVGGLYHETNTFAAGYTDLEAFAQYQYAEGVEILRKCRGSRTELGAFLDHAELAGWELVPMIFAAAVPSGMVSRKAYEALVERMLERIQGPVDGILLALHGAMVTAEIEDCEDDLLRRIREATQHRCPIAATFDIHANLSKEIVEHSDLLVGYDTYPHVDIYERALEAARLFGTFAATNSRPRKSFRKLPLLTAPQAQSTDSRPMRDVLAKLHDWESKGEILSASVAVGFPYADVARAGASVLAYSLTSRESAEACASDVAECLWGMRHSFVTHNIPPAKAVGRALQAPEGPVILVDVADNIGGGAPGDGTVLLRALLDARASNCVVTIADAAAVKEAASAGEGAEVKLVVGGKHDRQHGKPVPVAGRVVRVAEGRYTHRGSYMTGLKVNMGKSVVVRCNGVELVLTERKAMPFDAEQLRSLRIEPGQKRIIVVKSAIAWKAAYGDVAREVIYVDTPGICSSDLRRFAYKTVPRPIFPLDEI